MNKPYVKPDINLLRKYEPENEFNDREYIKELGQELSDFFKVFKVNVQIADCKVTPFSVCFDVIPGPGVNIKKITDLRDEIALRFAYIVETEFKQEEQKVYISMRNLKKPLIGFRDILESDEFKNNDYALPVAAGMDVLGNPFCFDLETAPHLLVAGTTGSGKSMFLNVIILSIMFTKTPDEVSFIMVDPKRVELGQYNKNPFLIRPVSFDSQHAMDTLNWVSSEIDRRFETIAILKKKNIDDYNAVVKENQRLKKIVIVIDEYADLARECGKELEDLVAKITRNGRITGIHLILSTQQPSKKILSNAIKGYIPRRASFTVVDWRESKAIIHRTGAERLRGAGDMLFSASSESMTHVQSSFVSDSELDSMIDYIREHNS